jgi:hypothetical protein
LQYGSLDICLTATAGNKGAVRVNFAQEHKDMVASCRMIVGNGYLAIDHRFDKLIISLRTAVDTMIERHKQRLIMLEI